MSAPPRPLVAANWKMHLVPAEAADFCRRLAPEVGEVAAEVAIFPSFPLLPAVAAALAGTAIAWGGQDLHPEEKGAHTGDVSGAQLAACGSTWVLCGHSERRRDHGESDALVGAKARAARRHGLIPLVCVGETGEERRAGRTLEVLRRQLGAAVAGLDRFAIAYEPVWAIGTGDTATPETAQEAHAFLRARLAELEGAAPGAQRILYGGSVTPDNAQALFAGADIDGFLVGGASLDPERFLAIIRACG
jgi:triosephosphate isomerase